jgi:multiple sugar transport system substrate-binding protein
MYWQYGVPVFDKASGKAKLTTDKHTNVLSMLQKFYAIPGYVQKNVYQPSPDTFFKDQRTAMYMNWIGAFYSYFQAAGTKDNFKWDLTAHPGYPDRPGLGKEVDFHMVVVNKSSKNREAAYQLLKMLSSDDVQTIISRAGRLPVVKNDAIRGQFGADNDMFKGKNLQAIFKVSPSPLPEASKYDVEINKLLTKDVSKAVVGGEDVNTALRKAEEKANKEIVVD